MPELPEVSVVVKYLKENICNTTISDVEIIKEKLLKNISVADFKKTIINQKITNLRRRGKYIIIDLEKNTLVSHLRMEGKFRIEEDANFIKEKHDYIFFNLGSKTLIYNDTRMFGTLEICDILQEQKLKSINKLGYEYDDVNLTKDYVFNILKQRKSAVKTLLLNQEIFTGLGNIYVDEVLFACKIHPLCKGCEISPKQCADIIKYSQQIMNKSIEYGGTTVKSYTSGKNRKGSYQQFLQVYGKNNLQCLRCQVATITKIKVNGRGTHYCPNCQKEC